MKSRLKGLLALTLSLVMMLSMVTVSYGLATDYAITANTVEHVSNILGSAATVSGTDGNVTIKLNDDVNRRIRFDGTNGDFVLDLAGYTINGSGANEALCLDNNFNGSVTIIGSGTLNAGNNNIIYKGSSATLKFDVSDGYDYFTLKKDGEDVFTNEKNTTATSLNKTYFTGTDLVLTQGHATPYPASIGGVSFNEINLTIDSEDITGVTGSATYVPQNGINPATLTLNNFTFEDTRQRSAISSDQDLTLNLIGDNNSVTASSTRHSGAAAIIVDGNLTIDGTGSLTASGISEGIHAYNVTIESGEVTATGTNDYGIFASDEVTISGGNVTATGGWEGIYAGDTVTISGGKVTANVADNSGIGIKATNSITIGGNINKNPEVTVGCATGLKADTVNILENSTVSITADSKAINSTTLNMGRDPWYQWSDKNGGPYKSTDNQLDETKAAATNILTIEKISTGAPGNTNPYPPYIYNPTPTPEPEGEKVTSSNTFDGGIASAVVVTILSATGGAWLAKKKD